MQCVCCLTCCFDMKAGKTLTAGSSGGLEHLAARLRTVAVASDLFPFLFWPLQRCHYTPTRRCVC
jgi:hypothetical protein